MSATTNAKSSGIKAAYAPEDLVDRLTVVVANLAQENALWCFRRHGTGCYPRRRRIFLPSPDSGASRHGGEIDPLILNFGG